MGISDAGDTSQSFLVAVNDNVNPENNAFAILVGNNLAAGFINNSDSGNPAATLPYCGFGSYSNTPGLIPTDKLSVRDGTIGLHSYDKTILGTGALDVLRLCYDPTDYRLYQSEGNNLTVGAYNLVTRKVLDELDDCVINTPVLGQSLTYDGINWINQTPAPTTSTIAGATDYDNSTPATDLQVI